MVETKRKIFDWLTIILDLFLRVPDSITAAMESPRADHANVAHSISCKQTGG